MADMLAGVARKPGLTSAGSDNAELMEESDAIEAVANS